MDTKKKKKYAAPTTDVVELRTEGQLLQMSGGDFPNGLTVVIYSKLD